MRDKKGRLSFAGQAAFWFESLYYLIDPVTVTTGLSDGLTVELTSGLTTGDTYYYACYDTPDISETPDFGSGFSRLPFGK